MQDTRRSYRVIKLLEATKIDDSDLCSADADTDDSTIGEGDFLWAYPEKDGYIRFTKGFFATFCVRSTVFADSTERVSKELR